MAILNNKNLMLVGLKGATGSKIVSTELIGQDEHGGNIYKQTFDDGTTAEFVAPKGEKGDSGSGSNLNFSYIGNIANSPDTIGYEGQYISTNNSEDIQCNSKFYK